jgi:hypothetical protein
MACTHELGDDQLITVSGGLLINVYEIVVVTGLCSSGLWHDLFWQLVTNSGEISYCPLLQVKGSL